LSYKSYNLLLGGDESILF